MSDPLKIFLDVVARKSIDQKWVNSPNQAFKNLPNTNKGDIGEEFTKIYVETFGNFTVETEGGRTGEWDVKIGGKKFEIKTSSQDKSGAFQFNHIRLDSKYHYVLCIGVRPNDLLFFIWSKADVATGEAGTLVSMASKGNSSFKLTKKSSDLKPISDLNKMLLEMLEGK